MNLEELRRVQSKERRTDSLQNLRPSFYQEVGEYIADLKTERERAADLADDPFSSPEVNRLTDEIETATDVVEAIYERRMGKLVKQASLAAAGMPADDEGLTAEEADLFEDLVERIRTNKGRVLDVLEGAEAASASGTTPAEPNATGTPPEAPQLEARSAETGATDPTEMDATDPSEATDATGASTAPPDAGRADGSVSAADAMGSGSATSDERDDPSARTVEDPATDGRSANGEAGDGAHRDGGPDRDPDASNEGRNASKRERDASDQGRDAPTRERDASGTEADASDRGATDEGDEAVDRVTVRITRDVGPILGIDDREYTLKADDVVALPERNAAPLVEREAAEPLE